MSGPETRTGAALQDANGHLTAAGLAAFKDAPIGQAPAPLAGHIAGCAACQERLLVAGAPGPRPRPGQKPRPLAPSPGHTALLLGLTLLMILFALWSLRRLVEP
jgi:hypothetical protein